ncbi:MAG: glycoside hydrolase family 3 N-terminal domain-containing protein, partial [Victivallaceae bacterium]
IMEIYKNPQYSVEERVSDLLKQMTIDEKLGQMRMVSGREYPTEVEYLQDIRDGKVGFRIGFFSPWQPLDWVTVDLTEINRQKKTAVEESRLGIPLIVSLDVIHGHRTVAPIPLAQAAAWEPELVRQSAAMAAREAASQGVHWTFAPMVDITHDPRWGRVIETFGEDPYLAGILAAAAVDGFQYTNQNPRESLQSCVKHFAGYGYAEGGRDYDYSEISSYTLFNYILPPFKAAVEAGVSSVMSSFQATNGTPSSSSEFLLREVLRKKWNFDGVVVSDYAATEQVEFHGAAQDEFDAAAKAFRAGIDVEMVANLLNKYGKKLLESGQISLARLDECVSAILRMKFRAGLFEHPYTDPQRRDELLFCDAHRKLVRTQAAAGMVLAKNRNQILPLNRDELKKSQKKIIICGPMIYERSALQGAWALGSKTNTTATLAEA